MDTSVEVASRHTLPVISFAGRDEQTLARQLDKAFSDIGFCYFADIGVDRALVDGVFAASRRFHALPRAAKEAIAMNRFHRGYMAPKTSIIQTSSVAKVTKPNDSESFMLMHEVPEDDPRHGRPLDGPNLWPDLPDFRAPVEAYERAMRAFCLRLLQPLGVEAAIQAITQCEHQSGEKRRQIELALEQARYEATRARRQYDAVDRNAST